MSDTSDTPEAPDTSTDIVVKNDLPRMAILPLRNTVVYPHMPNQLNAGRERSLRALEQAAEGPLRLLQHLRPRARSSSRSSVAFIVSQPMPANATSRKPPKVAQTCNGRFMIRSSGSQTYNLYPARSQ